MSGDTQKTVAAIDMIGRTGSTGVQIRYQDDEQPVVWLAVALYPEERWETASAATPETAVLRLCEQLIDGGLCVHCERPSLFSPDISTDTLAEATGLCETSWDPELGVFRRSCEGDTA